MFKAGFVNIVGNPNVGKSTLMNKLVGDRLSIITNKSQTTRHRITGIVNGKDYQIVYSDTPGVLEPNYKLQESMLNFSKSALADADILVYVTDTIEQSDKNLFFMDQVAKMDVPVFVLINKIDLSNQEDLERIVKFFNNKLPKAEIFPISVLRNFNIDNLQKRILDLLPENPPYFGTDALTDKSSRFFVTEIIRQKILLYYQKEIPYAAEVAIETYTEGDKMIKIRAVINVERESQKGIIIGHKGLAIKKTGTEARKDIEIFLDKKVNLELFVKVDKDWRNNVNRLKAYGYQQD